MDEFRNHFFSVTILFSFGDLFFQNTEKVGVVLSVYNRHSLKKKNRINTITKLALQGCIYNIWLERNARLHTQKARTADSITHLVMQDIHNRLLAIRIDWVRMVLLFSLAATMNYCCVLCGSRLL